MWPSRTRYPWRLHNCQNHPFSYSRHGLGSSTQRRHFIGSRTCHHSCLLLSIPTLNHSSTAHVDIIERERLPRSQKQWRSNGRRISSMNSRRRHSRPIQRNYSRQSRQIDQQFQSNSTHIGEPFPTNSTHIGEPFPTNSTHIGEPYQSSSTHIRGHIVTILILSRFIPGSLAVRWNSLLSKQIRCNQYSIAPFYCDNFNNTWYLAY